MKAFTLIETLMTIAIFIILMGAVAGFIMMGYRTYGYVWEQTRAIEEARRGIETMIKEIREARPGDDGSYPIEKAEDKEFIFYSDIDKDGKTEKVRYFLGTESRGSQVKECVTFAKGGSCSLNFSNFLSGALKKAEVKVSVEGDFGWNKEYADIYADTIKLGRICKTGCSDCAGRWQGTSIFDITSQASDNSLWLTADSNSNVDPFCDWQEVNHSMKALFELSWQEEIAGGQMGYLRKGVTKPTTHPIQYPPEQEEITILSTYVRNAPPIFEYFDAAGNKIEDYPARLKDTKLMKVYLIVDVNPNREPSPFELEGSVQLRNIK